jgi:Ca2+-binding RTX toxin-like protein
VTVQDSDISGANDQFSSSISGGFQDTTVVSSGTADFTMNDGQVFPGIRVNYVRGPDGETYMMPDDGPSPFAQNAFKAMLFNNSSGINSFTIATGSGDDAGINPIEGNWADGQFFETTDGTGGDDTIIGGLGADSLFGEGGDDTFVVGSAAEGAGDVISGGNGPDETTDLDVLDLRGAGEVTIDDAADANDAGATAGTVTFEDGSTLEFEGIEEILQDPDGPVPDGIVDGLDAGELMNPGYTDAEGDQIDGTDGIDDLINGNGGPDTINAGLGDDSVLGGEDDDVIDGGDGNDTLLGNEGNDDLDGGDGDDTLLGGDEADTLTGGDGADSLQGEDGDDDIAVGGADTAEGGLGDDIFTLDPTDASPDVDVLIDGGSDATTGDPAGPENGDEGDILDLSDVTEDLTVVFDPDDGEDGTVDGLDDDGTPDITFEEIEQVITGAGDDEVTGPELAGPCIISTGEGDDTVTGSGGDDIIDGGDDDDLLDGGDGDDSLIGGDGNDTLDGGEGADTLDGGLNDDDITVGAGDTGLGGGGDDVFTVDPAVTGTAPITVVGGETDEEDIIDPTNNPDGRIGDVLDLTGLGPVEIAYDETDPTFDPVTGVGESGTVTYTNDDGLPVVINFSEIEDIVTDPQLDGTPVANPDTAEVVEEGVVTIDVLANDTDPDNAPEELSVVDADAPNGIVDINDDGTLSYEPDAGFTGTDTITYTVTNPDGNEATSTVTVTVTPDVTAGAPDAVEDVYDFDMVDYEGGNVRLGRGDDGLLGNDTDPDGDPLRVVEIDGSSNLRVWVDADNGGEIRISSSGAVRFRDSDGDFADLPDGEVAQTSVTYTISDGNGGTDTATITVNVTGAADVGTSAPDAVDDTASATAGDVTVIDVLANDTDADTPIADLEVIDAEAEDGIVDINDDGTLSYEPDAGFTGTDTITYTITDPEGNTDTAVVTVNVVEGEVTPIANPDTADVDEDGSVTIDVLANDTDPDTPVEELEVIDATAPNGEVEINDDGTLEYTPDPDYSGTDVITYTVTDPDGNTATGTATVEVAPVNDAPEAVDDTAATDEETPVTIDVLSNDSDIDNIPEELSVIDAEATDGIVDINDDGTLTYEPDAGFTGTDVITYTISDPDGATSTASVTVTVAAVDVTPVANPDIALVDEDDSVTIDVLANDTDPDTPVEELEVIDATAPNGEVEINDDGTLEYTPDPDFNGEDVITYTITDPDGNTASSTVVVAIAAVNDAPVAENDTATTPEETEVTIDVLANDSDVEDGNEELTVTAASAPNGEVEINDDGTLSYTPDADYSGTDTITYTVTDTAGATASATVAVEVTDVADTPVANPDTADVDEDDSVTIDVLANDTDPDTPVEELEVIDATAPNGEVEINDDGTLEYTPDPDFNGTDVITYTVTDPDGNTATGTATVEVAPVNDAPVAEDDTASTDEGETVTIDVLANDSDVEDGNDLDVTSASASNGDVTINDDGTLDYTPDAGFSGPDSITYTVTDSDGATDTALVSVTVNEVTGGDGVVDGDDDGEVMDPGYDDGEVMDPGYDDGEGDQIDGTDGDDTIDGGAGDDEIDGGEGDDVIRGGDGNDTIEGSEGTDDILGGAGDDTYQGDDEGHMVVYVDNDGNGDVTKYPSQEVDSVNSIETFSGAEIEGEDDKISFTTAVSENSIEEDIQGLDDNATGYFFPADGNFINFGPENDYTLSDIFSGTSPDGELPAVGPVGEFFVNGGTEDGQVGDISFENFEQIFFSIEEAPEEEDDIMQLISNGEAMDETMPLDEDIEDEEDLLLGM